MSVSMCMCMFVHACMRRCILCVCVFIGRGDMFSSTCVCMCVHVHYLELVIPTSNSIYSQIKMIMY